VWGHEYVITSLLEIPVLDNKKEVSPFRWGYSRPNLIRSHAQRLSGTRPSSAVHHFGPSFSTTRRVFLEGALVRLCTIQVPKPTMWRPANTDRRCTTCGKFFPSARAWFSRLNHVNNPSFRVPDQRCMKTRWNNHKVGVKRQFVTVFLTASPLDVAGDPDLRSKPIIGSDAD
jgi:hypothetical protein